ncbi:MAG: hypothetical protein CMK24_00815 [Porticoccaceae bacterium]|nr:hypothetical protein [Porticoccaceae bacterium]|tara:strand:+ start:615 stop:887 length:273 start_codon:yes stop_codon:yes gene_type:complete
MKYWGPLKEKFQQQRLAVHGEIAVEFAQISACWKRVDSLKEKLQGIYDKESDEIDVLIKVMMKDGFTKKAISKTTGLSLWKIRQRIKKFN